MHCIHTISYSPKFSPPTCSQTICFTSLIKAHSCIDIILYEITQQNTFSATLIQNRLFEIICEITRSIGIAGNFKCSHDNVSDSLSILKAKQYISDNKDKLLDCAEVAGYCHYNVRYLSRIFARQTGFTLLEYIHNEKPLLSFR